MAASTPSRSPQPLLPSFQSSSSSLRARALHTPPRAPVTLTWRDLCVTVDVSSSSSHGGSNNSKNSLLLHRHLLHGLAGFAAPGSLMSIIGPSGSGKSTLLDTLAGRLSSKARQSGEILVNGKRQTLSYGNLAYVKQDDVLMASLTVREAVYYSAQLQLPNDMPLAEKKARAEEAIREMGLKGAVNTRIGGWRARGVSGGEKRRVTIAIEILTHPQLLFLDEPTSGLDSAAAFHVVKRLKHLAQIEGRTVIASIHQPSSDVFEIFDFLCLLSSGRTIYFGPASGAQEFFAANGFPCPALRNPSDHYLRIINTDFEQLEQSDDIEGGGGGRIEAKTTKIEQVVDMLAESYVNSDIAANVASHINALAKMNGPLLKATSNRSTFFTQVYVLTVRSFKNMYRDLGYYWLRFVIYVALSITLGTIYYKVGTCFNSIQARASMLVFVSGFLTFMSIGGFPAFVEDMKVFHRERSNGHYGVASFVVANTISSAPFLFFISALPGAITYFLADLHHGAGHFLYFVLQLYSCMLVVESLMMMVASAVPDFLLGIITGAGIQGVFLLTAGFFRLSSDIPKPVWRYPLSYIAFHTYAFEGFFKNDFTGLTFENIIPGAARITGDSILNDTYRFNSSFSKWMDLWILLGMAVSYRMLFFCFIKLKENLQPVLRGILSRNSAPKVIDGVVRST